MDLDQDQAYMVSDIDTSSHQRILSESVSDFLVQRAFLDVALVCKGEEIMAHRIVLSAFSPLFEKLLKETSRSHPIIIFNDVSKEDMIPVLRFIYSGKIPKASSLAVFLNLGKNLQIRGLEHLISKGDEPQIVSEETPSNKHRHSRETSRISNSETVKEPAALPMDKRTTLKISTIKSPTSESRSTVVNPFALRGKSVGDSDSTFCEDDLPRPGPSKSVLSSSPLPKNYDSDIEIIDNNSILVINDSQSLTNRLDRYRFRQSKNKKRIKGEDENKASIHYSSDDSEVGVLPKKSRKALIKYSDEEAVDVRVNPLAMRSKTTIQQSNSSNVSASVESPLLMPQDKRSRDGEKIQQKKNKQILSKEEKHKATLKLSLRKLRRYCVICHEVIQNFKRHIKQNHNVPPRLKKFICRICSKKFYHKKLLSVHLKSIHEK